MEPKASGGGLQLQVGNFGSGPGRREILRRNITMHRRLDLIGTPLTLELKLVVALKPIESDRTIQLRTKCRL